MRYTRNFSPNWTKHSFQIWSTVEWFHLQHSIKIPYVFILINTSNFFQRKQSTLEWFHLNVLIRSAKLPCCNTCKTKFSIRFGISGAMWINCNYCLTKREFPTCRTVLWENRIASSLTPRRDRGLGGHLPPFGFGTFKTIRWPPDSAYINGKLTCVVGPLKLGLKTGSSGLLLVQIQGPNLPIPRSIRGVIMSPFPYRASKSPRLA